MTCCPTLERCLCARSRLPSAGSPERHSKSATDDKPPPNADGSALRSRGDGPRSGERDAARASRSRAASGATASATTSRTNGTMPYSIWGAAMTNLSSRGGNVDRATAGGERNFASAPAISLWQETTMPKEGNQIVETPVEARGGFLGRPVFLVLAVSLVLAIGAMALSYAGFFATT